MKVHRRPVLVRHMPARLLRGSALLLCLAQALVVFALSGFVLGAEPDGAVGVESMHHQECCEHQGAGAEPALVATACDCTDTPIVQTDSGPRQATATIWPPAAASLMATTALAVESELGLRAPSAPPDPSPPPALAPIRTVVLVI